MRSIAKRKIVLVFPFDLLSHYLRCIKLSENYSEYEIIFAYSEKYKSFVKDAGYLMFEADAFDPDEVMRCAADFSFSWLNPKAIEKIFLSQYEAIKKYQPALVIGDASPTLKMAAEKAGVHYVSLVNGYMSRYYAGKRYLPGSHFLNAVMNVLPDVISNFFLTAGSSFYFRKIHRPFRLLRKKYGLKSVKNYLEENEGDETLICDTKELFPQKQLPQHYKQIGPLIYDADKRGSDIVSVLKPESPAICVSLGSTGDWQALSFLNSEEYSKITIIAAGDEKRVLQASHIISAKFLNLNEILPHCSLLICHGGNGTVYAGLRAGVYIMCFTSHFEQEWNARRLEELGLGKWINNDPKAFIDQYIRGKIFL